MSGARRLGRYVVGERLGSGGLGEVYLAHVDGARGFRKRLVVKQVRRELARRPEVAPLLVAEAEVVQRLAHGNIVQLLDVGVDDGAPYLVMEHVDGVSLAELSRDLAQRGESLGPGAALFVVESVCAALAHAHAARGADDRPLGLVHRDVTPANILVSRDGVVKLTDFGIASITALDPTALPGPGTPGYAAPEQLAGARVDARADVHALGVVLGEWVATASADVDDLRPIVARATAPAPADRHPDITALAAELERWRASRRISHDPGELADRVRALQRRRDDVARHVGAALAQRHRPPQTEALPPPRRRARGPWLALAALPLLAGLAWIVRAPGDLAAPIDPPPRAAEPPAPIPPAPVVVAEVTPDDAPRDVADPPHPAPPAIDALPRPRPAAPAKAGRGRLLVNLVPWAEASVDGRALGRTPLSVELAPGRHTLELANPDLGQRRTRAITITRGADTHITDW